MNPARGQSRGKPEGAKKRRWPPYRNVTHGVPLLWIEVGAAAVGGGVVGWFSHALLRRRKVTFPRDGPPAPPRAETSSVGEAVAARRTAGRTVSAEADTAGRVILHLAGLGRLAYDDVGLVGHTQAGMSDALKIRQGTLTKVLSRLVAAKVVEVDRRHVQGEPRRLNAYRLTALGESAARDIRHRRATEQNDATKLPSK